MDKNVKEVDVAVALFEERFGPCLAMEQLPGAGSDRRYYRLKGEDGLSVVATFGEDVMENRTFFRLAEAFRRSGVPVPEVYVINKEGTVYLQEDLGDIQLLSLLSTDRRRELSEKSLKALTELQTIDESVWGDKVAWAPFSRRLIMWDLNYFKYEFLKPAAVFFNEDGLEDDFESFANALCATPEELLGFMYRDFQSRNVMVKEGEPWLIDFQGGRKGPIMYDAVSFLWQAKAGFSEEERRSLLTFYVDIISRKRGVDVDVINKEVGKFALFRTLQVLGAYGFRGLVERKAHFIESIPGALANLRELLEKGVVDDYPTLKDVCRRCVESRFAKTDMSDGRLTVKVFSFSYKRGYPEDLTGNGGGFMFDCRGMHNPGRYERYKPLTGLDAEVRDFLEEKGEVQGFIKAAFDMVAPVIARYEQRGFSSLQVGFGCTGGRHRSVYCARGFAEEVSRRFPGVRVELIHREQGIREEFNANLLGENKLLKK